jgi:hypothetical protein
MMFCRNEIVVNGANYQCTLLDGHAGKHEARLKVRWD